MIDKNDSSRTSGSNRQKVIVERTYNATVEELWQLWTTKDGFELWWGPEGFRAEVHTMEARLDGVLHYDMIADSPEMVAAMKQMGHPVSHKTHARFTEFAPYGLLSITSLIDFLPGVTSYDSTIKVEFFPSGNTVRMIVTLDPMHSDEFTQMQKEGFTSQLSKLDKRYGWKPA